MIAKIVEPCPKLRLDHSKAHTPQHQSQRIRALNDALRRTGKGGRVMYTDGIVGQGLEFAAAVMKAVTSFDAFNPDNDPWDEPDCATVKLGQYSVIWKIDYYDRDLTYHSPDPADTNVTARVLTVMLAEEY